MFAFSPTFKKALRIATIALAVCVVFTVAFSATTVFAQETPSWWSDPGGFMMYHINNLGTAITNNFQAAMISAYNTIWGYFVDAVGMLVINIVAFFLWLAGLLMTAVVDFTVINAARTVDAITAINDTWIVFRDIANMAFIFIILYLAFQMILGVGSGHWRSLGWLILMAILLNFSLFFTKVVIDLSNALSTVFIGAITGGTGTSGGIVGMIMTQLGLPTFYADTTATVESLFAKGGDPNSKMLMYMGGSVFILITTFIFLVISVLLIIRFVYLLFAMILSPLAFAAYVIPSMKKYFDQWWHSLWNQAFFAPAMFALLWVSFRLLSGINAAVSSGGPIGTFGDLLGAMQTASVNVALTFAISIATLIYSVTTAKKLGAVGATKMSGWGRRLAGKSSGFVGRNTVGRLSGGINKWAEGTTFGRSRLGASTLAATTGALAASKYGGDVSYKQFEEKRQSDLKKGLDKAGTDADRLLKAYTATGRSTGDRKLMVDALSDQQRAVLEQKLAETGARPDGFFSGRQFDKAAAVFAGEVGDMKGGAREKYEAAYIKELGKDPAAVAARLDSLDETTKQNVFSQMSARQQAQAHAALGAGGDSLVEKLDLESREKFEEAFLQENRGESAEIARRLTSLDEDLRAHVYGKLSARDRAEVEQELRNYGAPLTVAGAAAPVTADTLVDQLRHSLTKEEADKTTKAAREHEVDAVQEELRHDFQTIAEAIRGAIASVPGATNLEQYFAGGGAPVSYTDHNGATHSFGTAADAHRHIRADLGGQAHESTIESLNVPDLAVLTPAMSAGHFKTVMGSKKVSRNDRDQLMNARYHDLGVAMGGGVFGVAPGGTPNAAAVASVINGLKPEEVGALPENVLVNPTVIDSLTPAALQELKVGIGARRQIGDHIRRSAASGTPHPAYDYVTTGPGKDLWK